MPKFKKAKTLPQFNTSTYLVLFAVLIIGFFLGAQYQKTITYDSKKDLKEQYNRKTFSMDNWETFTVMPISDTGYTLQIPPDSGCDSLGDGPPVNFGSDAPASDYCFHGVYANGDEYPYGLIIDYTYLPEESAKSGLLKAEYTNGVPSDINFVDQSAVMLEGQKEIAGKKIKYSRYVINGEDSLWYMFTIQTDQDSTNLDLYKHILSTFEPIN